MASLRLQFPGCNSTSVGFELTVYQAGGEKREVRAGEVSLESVNVVHKGVNEGAVPLQMVVFVAGLKDVPFTIEDEAPLEEKTG